MGLIRAVTGAVGGVLADQWKEFFYCESLDKNTLVVKGEKRVGSRSQNRKGNDNIISNGSGVVVADGQCMIIVDQGEIVEFCAEPGQFTYDTSSEPSIFSGDLGTSILESFKTMGRRIGFGGDTGRDQRVYYFNTKEIVDNKFGTQNPVPFRVVDSKIGLDIDVSVRCNGVYSWKLVDPILFYTNVTGNVEEAYTKDQIEGQMKTELVHHLGPAFSKISEMEVRPNQLPGMGPEITKALKEQLTSEWTELRGIEIVAIALNSVTIPKEDEDLIKQAQRAAIMRDPTMAAANITAAQADAMRMAAQNEGGALTGFMGLGMAGQAGAGANTAGLYQLGQQQQQMQAQQQAQQAPPQAAPGWKCSCGAVNQGKFCAQCGQPKPEPKAPEGGWSCPECGHTNTGKFCSNCGTKKPEVDKVHCDKCGWEPKDPAIRPKFCPECGTPFGPQA